MSIVQVFNTVDRHDSTSSFLSALLLWKWLSSQGLDDISLTIVQSGLFTLHTSSRSYKKLFFRFWKKKKIETTKQKVPDEIAKNFSNTVVIVVIFCVWFLRLKLFLHYIWI